MKHFKNLCAACVLALALALSAFAGDMEAGVTSQPPPPQQATAQGEMSASVTGEISTPGVTGDIPFPGVTGDMPTGGIATGSTTNFFLSLFQGLMSLF